MCRGASCCTVTPNDGRKYCHKCLKLPQFRDRPNPSKTRVVIEAPRPPQRPLCQGGEKNCEVRPRNGQTCAECLKLRAKTERAAAKANTIRSSTSRPSQSRSRVADSCSSDGSSDGSDVDSGHEQDKRDLIDMMHRLAKLSVKVEKQEKANAKINRR